MPIAHFLERCLGHVHKTVAEDAFSQLELERVNAMIILSPAKKLNEDFHKKSPLKKTQPLFEDEIGILLASARKLSVKDLMALMGISQKLAELNHERFASMELPINVKENVEAIFIFDGDVYSTLKARELDDKTILYLNSKLRILSGLYGYLRPSDAVMPYRLEMGVKFPNHRGSTLYDFWRNVIGPSLKEEMLEAGDKILINLASQEYSKAVNFKIFDGIELVNVHFKEKKDGGYKVVGVHAKRARGSMTRFIALNQIETSEGLKDFNEDGYKYMPELSNGPDMVFAREEQDK